MRFHPPLEPGQLVRRYKRFLADVVLQPGGEETTVHCPNPGSMMGLLPEEARVWLAGAAGPSRKLPYTWEIVEAGGSLVGVNPSRANGIVAEALAAREIAQLEAYETVLREVPYIAGTRFDFRLEAPTGPPCLLEVKSVTLMRTPGIAEFPDAVTKRGARHVAELANAKAAGFEAALLFLVQRSDCNAFAVASDIDPLYAQALARCREAGVKVLCYDCDVSTEEIRLRAPLPLADMNCRD